jgi:hypothetical protein
MPAERQAMASRVTLSRVAAVARARLDKTLTQTLCVAAMAASVVCGLLGRRPITPAVAVAAVATLERRAMVARAAVVAARLDRPPRRQERQTQVAAAVLVAAAPALLRVRLADRAW